MEGLCLEGIYIVRLKIKMWCRLLVLIGILLQVSVAFRTTSSLAQVVSKCHHQYNLASTVASTTCSLRSESRLYAKEEREYLGKSPDSLAKRYQDKKASRSSSNAVSKSKKVEKVVHPSTTTGSLPPSQRANAAPRVDKKVKEPVNEKKQIDELERELMQMFGNTLGLQKKNKLSPTPSSPVKQKSKKKGEEYSDDEDDDADDGETEVKKSKQQKKLLDKSISKFEGFGSNAVSSSSSSSSSSGGVVAGKVKDRKSNQVQAKDDDPLTTKPKKQTLIRQIVLDEDQEDDYDDEDYDDEDDDEDDEDDEPVASKSRLGRASLVQPASPVKNKADSKTVVVKDNKKKEKVTSLPTLPALDSSLRKKIAEVKPKEDLRDVPLSRDIVMQLLEAYNKKTSASVQSQESEEEEDEPIDLDQWDENRDLDDDDDDDDDDEDEEDKDEEESGDYRDESLILKDSHEEDEEDEDDEPAFEVWDGSSNRKSGKVKPAALVIAKKDMKVKQAHIDEDDYSDEEEEEVTTTTAKKTSAFGDEDGFRLRKPSEEEVRQRAAEDQRRQAKKDEKEKLMALKSEEKVAKKDSLTNKFFAFDFPPLQQTERGQVFSSLYPQSVEDEELTGSYGTISKKQHDNNDDYEDYDDDDEDEDEEDDASRDAVGRAGESVIEKHNRELLQKKAALVPESKKIFSSKTFADLGITDQEVLYNLEKIRIMQATRIQELSIPVMLRGENVILQAQTGSGKTLAYLLPLLDIVDVNSDRVQAIILAPSRELVHQIGKVASAVFEGSGIRVLTMMGGANAKNQLNHLRDDRPQVVVASPGRLAEMIFRYEKLRLSNVRGIVIDEVDQMLRAPFYDEVKTIFEAIPMYMRRRQRINDQLLGVESNTHSRGEQSNQSEDEELVVPQRKRKSFICLASATAKDNEAVVNFANEYCLSELGAGPDQGWHSISVDYASMLPPTITHAIISCPRIKAFEMLKKFLNAKPFVQRALIFVNDPYRVEVVCQKLLAMGLIAAPLHGESSKDDRKEVLNRIRDGRLRLVVTTEIAARGLDIPELTHVINFELPTDTEHYVHRTGRCGRAGKPGLAVNFATPETKFVIRRFAKRLGTKIHDCELRNGQVYLKEM